MTSEFRYGDVVKVTLIGTVFAKMKYEKNHPYWVFVDDCPIACYEDELELIKSLKGEN